CLFPLCPEPFLLPQDIETALILTICIDSRLWAVSESSRLPGRFPFIRPVFQLRKQGPFCLSGPRFIRTELLRQSVRNRKPLYCLHISLEPRKPGSFCRIFRLSACRTSIQTASQKHYQNPKASFHRRPPPCTSLRFFSF